MAAPVFPFDRPTREGHPVREIMCRRCAGWTAWDGEVWRHVDGTVACVQPETVWGQTSSPLFDEDSSEYDRPETGGWADEIADSEQQEVQN